MRSFWRNCKLHDVFDALKFIKFFINPDFEQTDAVIWVVDSSDVNRIDDCKEELHQLLIEEVKGR